MARLEKTPHRGDFWKLKAGEDFKRMEQLTNQVSFRLGFNGIVNDVVIRETQRIVDAQAEHIVSRLKVMCGMESGGVDIDGGEVVGILLAFPVADGYAHYRVSKASPLTLQHVPYGDAWRIPAAHIRGLRKVDAIESERRRRGLAMRGRRGG